MWMYHRKLKRERPCLGSFASGHCSSSLIACSLVPHRHEKRPELRDGSEIVAEDGGDGKEIGGGGVELVELEEEDSTGGWIRATWSSLTLFQFFSSHLLPYRKDTTEQIKLRA